MPRNIDIVDTKPSNDVVVDWKPSNVISTESFTDQLYERVLSAGMAVGIVGMTYPEEITVITATT